MPNNYKKMHLNKLFIDYGMILANESLSKYRFEKATQFPIPFEEYGPISFEKLLSPIFYLKSSPLENSLITHLL